MSFCVRLSVTLLVRERSARLPQLSPPPPPTNCFWCTQSNKRYSLVLLLLLLQSSVLHDSSGLRMRVLLATFACVREKSLHAQLLLAQKASCAHFSNVELFFLFFFSSLCVRKTNKKLDEKSSNCAKTVSNKLLLFLA